MGISNNNPFSGGNNNNNPSTDMGGSSKDGGVLGVISAQRSASSDIGTSSDNNLFSGSSEVGRQPEKERQQQ